MEATSTRRIVTLGLATVVLLAAPAAGLVPDPGEELTDLEDRWCPPGSDPGDRSKCETAQRARKGWDCRLWATADPEGRVTTVVHDVKTHWYPLVRGLKCGIHEEVDETLVWWNEDMYAWFKATQCWAFEDGDCSDQAFLWALVDYVLCPLPPEWGAGPAGLPLPKDCGPHGWAPAPPLPPVLT